MRIRSFQMRIALLTVLCSSLALLVSSVAAWRIGWGIALNDIDSQMRGPMRLGLLWPVGPPPPGDFGPRGRGPDGGSPRGPGGSNFGQDSHGNGGPGPGAPGGGGRRGQRGGPPPDFSQIQWMQLSQPDQAAGLLANLRGGADADLSLPNIFVLRVEAIGKATQKTDNWPASLSVDEYTSLALKLAPPQSQPSADKPANAPFQGAGGPRGRGPFSGFQFGGPPLPVVFAAARNVNADGRLWRIELGANAERAMVIGVDLTPYQKNSWRMVSAFLWSIPVALAFIAIGAAFTASRALRPMNELIRLSEGMTASGLDRRIAAPTGDAEFRRLIDVFNGMMDRLERSFRQANRFSADAAHELRTPLTILQGQLERMLQQTPSGSPGQQQLERLLEEIHRIKSIVEKLLLLARMDAGQVSLNLVPLDLSAMCESIADDIQAIAPRIAVGVRIEPGVTALADAALLETAIQNIGMNAVKYNDENEGRIDIDLTRSGGRIRLSIANAGPRIAESDREKIFDRFYRADPSRSREIDGAGLGLSLAREIVLAHHGWLLLDPTDRELNRFDIILPETTIA